MRFSSGCASCIALHLLEMWQRMVLFFLFIIFGWCSSKILLEENFNGPNDLWVPTLKGPHTMIDYIPHYPNATSSPTRLPTKLPTSLPTYSPTNSSSIQPIQHSSNKKLQQMKQPSSFDESNTADWPANKSLCVMSVSYDSNDLEISSTAELSMGHQTCESTFSSSEGRYWFGMTLYIPKSWVYVGQTDDDENTDYAIHMRLRPGEGAEGKSIIEIRNYGTQLKINICGNIFNGTNDEAKCHVYWLGWLAAGDIIDIVIDALLVYEFPKGYLHAWRNNVLMVNESGLLTSFNTLKPPCVALGVYNPEWDRGISTLNDIFIVGVDELRIGNKYATYDQMYTGFGEPCGESCIPYNPHPSDDKSFVKGINFFLICCLIVSIFLVFVYSCASDERWFEFSDYKRDFLSFILWQVFCLIILFVTIFICILVYGLPQSLPNENPSWLSEGWRQWAKLHDWDARTVIIVIAFVLTYEFIYFSPLLMVPHQLEAVVDWENDKEFVDQIGLVIPCYNSEYEAVFKSIERAIDNGINHRHIIVVENNPRGKALDGYRAAKDHKTLYVCIAEGQKSRALYTGAKLLPAKVNYIFHMDDDTLMAENMVFDQSHFLDSSVSAVAFLRHCVPKSDPDLKNFLDGKCRGKDNLLKEKAEALKCNHKWRAWRAECHLYFYDFLGLFWEKYDGQDTKNYIDFWYKITDHFHAVQAHAITRAFVPGPAGLWVRERFIEVFDKHPALPFGEDIFAGFINLGLGYSVKSEMRCMVQTFTPNCLLYGSTRTVGYGASSLFKQRGLRWTISAVRVTGKSLWAFGRHYRVKKRKIKNVSINAYWKTTEKFQEKFEVCRKEKPCEGERLLLATIGGWLMFRFYRLREYKILFAQLIYPYFIIIHLFNGNIKALLILKLILFVCPLFRNLFINYICWYGNKEVQVSLRTVLYSPYYNWWLINFAVCGRHNCLLWYLPRVAPHDGRLVNVVPPNNEFQVREDSSSDGASEEKQATPPALEEKQATPPASETKQELQTDPEKQGPQPNSGYIENYDEYYLCFTGKVDAECKLCPVPPPPSPPSPSPVEYHSVEGLYEKLLK